MSAILVIDDSTNLLATLSGVLTRAGYEVVTAPDGRDAARVVAARGVDMVITDIVMPDKEGIETILELRRAHPGLKIVAMSGFAAIAPKGRGAGRNVDFLEVARELGADAAIRKPFRRDQLLALVAGLLDRS